MVAVGSRYDTLSGGRVLSPDVRSGTGWHRSRVTVSAVVPRVRRRMPLPPMVTPVVPPSPNWGGNASPVTTPATPVLPSLMDIIVSVSHGAARLST
jgi:hypothetical protein